MMSPPLIFVHLSTGKYEKEKYEVSFEKITSLCLEPNTVKQNMKLGHIQIALFKIRPVFYPDEKLQNCCSSCENHIGEVL